MCMGVDLPVSVYTRSSEEGFRFLETRLTDGCELPQQCWELNLYFLKQKPNC